MASIKILSKILLSHEYNVATIIVFTTVPRMFLKVWVAVLVLLPLVFTKKLTVRGNYDPGTCAKRNHGELIMVKDHERKDNLLVCTEDRGVYSWKTTDGSKPPGEFFNPGYDCLDILNKNMKAKDGFYWVNFHGALPKRVWCDMTIDGGGYMLIGRTNSTETWSVPSSNTTVEPFGPPQWSSSFGDVPVLDFRIQVATKDDFKDTKAHWSFRLNAKRALKNLMMLDSGGCVHTAPGIGDISYVKDLQTDEIVTKEFKCSPFGEYYHPLAKIGWSMMNSCLDKPCSPGFAFHPLVPIQVDFSGGFSFQVDRNASSTTASTTAFFGCNKGKCCACYGPLGGTENYCEKGCQGKNGGTVTKNAKAWFWIRSNPSRKVWNKCMEYELEEDNGDVVWHKLTGDSQIPSKGRCVRNEVLINDGVVKVGNNKTLNSLPLVKGLLSYREDNTKLYLSNGQSWEALGKEKQNTDLAHKLNLQMKEISELKRVQLLDQELNTKLKTKVQFLEQELNYTIEGLKEKSGKSCKDIYVSSKKTATSGVYWIRPLGGSSKEFRKAFPVYCDMETHGGGWTLVYSYTFTNYNNFGSASNAVTPRPNWPASGANVPISTTLPLDESSRGAIDFNLWKEIGKEILIKSNINDWIVCQPNGGSMVAKKIGPLICQNIKNVATKCQGIAPNRINWHPYGPYLDASSHFYFFDGRSTAGSWPTHDPCGKNSRNEKRGVTNPGGAIYIR